MFGSVRLLRRGIAEAQLREKQAFAELRRLVEQSDRDISDLAVFDRNLLLSPQSVELLFKIEHLLLNCLSKQFLFLQARALLLQIDLRLEQFLLDTVDHGLLLR